MAFRLPPLNTLRLFEAAARHLSFKLAARELEVTPSAVSHAIQNLEDWLGTSLFARSRRGLLLTEAGANFYPAVRDALSLIARASDHIPGSGPRNKIRISVTPTFGARFLLSRLGRFRDRHPTTSVFIDTTHRQVEFPRDGADLAIRMGTGRWQGLVAEHLLWEHLVPLCAPTVKERLRDVTNVRDLPLIHVTTASQDWQAWFDAVGAGPVDHGRGLKVDTIQMAIDAAVRGLGVVLGRRPLVDDELASGALVPVLDRTIRSKVSYWLVGLSGTVERPEIRAFRDWLLEELAVFSVGGTKSAEPTNSVVDSAALRGRKETIGLAGRTPLS